MNYWLLKSEPSAFGIADLKRAKSSIWDGVRNYQARIYLRAAQAGDLAFFYHSNAEPTGIAGLCSVLASNIADPTQFDPRSKYFDPKSSPAMPCWQTVKVKFEEAFPRVLTLEELKAAFSPGELMVVRKGMRLSVMPVSAPVAARILELARLPAPPGR